jgi:membrane-anchored protein YejM (alkaline phosphatase superfamily)
MYYISIFPKDLVIFPDADYYYEKIGEFLSYLRDSGLAQQSLIIITLDHGEEFKEHGSFLHCQPYYRPNLLDPLIMHIPNYPREEIRIDY